MEVRYIEVTCRTIVFFVALRRRLERLLLCERLALRLQGIATSRYVPLCELRGRRAPTHAVRWTL